MRPDPLCNQKTVAERLDISERTLERWRVEGTGPAYLKAGRRVLYRQSDVDTWLNASKRVSTSQVLGG
ncbi:helix-turn-helix transcriptional regulator [Roseibium sp.]|uniref:helix-turn-helix transcriptional regulator n=1 Tax=Roseibium sp. TaxID=1936156 RepID=UPI003BAAB88C